MKTRSIKVTEVTDDGVMTVEMSENVANDLFLIGLQLYLDKNFKHKVVVIPYDGTIECKHSFDMPDEISNLCIEIAVNDILKKALDDPDRLFKKSIKKTVVKSKKSKK